MPCNSLVCEGAFVCMKGYPDRPFYTVECSQFYYAGSRGLYITCKHIYSTPTVCLPSAPNVPPQNPPKSVLLQGPRVPAALGTAA